MAFRIHLRVFALVVASVTAPVSATELALATAIARETADSNTPIDIPDAVLRKAVEEALSKTPGDPITRGEMATLEWLSANGVFPRENGVEDLAGIEYAINLNGLNLLYGRISDLAPLAGLTSLTYLSLPYNAIEDASPLAGLTSLTELYLNYNAIANVGALVGLTSLTELGLQDNRIRDLAPIVANTGLGDGHLVYLHGNPLTRNSLETHIPMLLGRGVDVQFNALPELPEMPDTGLREAVDEAIYAWFNFQPESADLSALPTIDGAGRSIEDLTGLERISGLKQLFLDRNKITDIAPLAELDLWALTLAYNRVEDWTPLASMDGLDYVSLDGNSLREVPSLPSSVLSLSFSDNFISDIGYLANFPSLLVLRMDGNSITSLQPLAEMTLRHLHMNDNQVADLSPLTFARPFYEPMLELHMRNNAVRDISPLLDGEGLLMVDVRRNPLADNALAVLKTLRERRVTVLAGETVPYFPAAGQPREGFVRIVNRGNENGHVFIEAVDDAGVRAGPARLDVGARRAGHFDSADLEDGNTAKGIDGIGAPTAGDWRLSVISALDVEVLSYIRTEDGFFTAMHDVVPDSMVPFFNPGSNLNRRSVLRMVNMEAEPAKWTTGGYDDRGKWHPMTGSMLVRPQHALTLTAQALEDDHGLGDGLGKWRLRVRGFPWFAMNLLENPAGHLTNLSTAPDNATPLADGRTVYRLPLFPAAGGAQEGLVRLINRSDSSGEVTIEAVDDGGGRSRPVRLALRPRRATHFNATDLEVGNVVKGLVGGLGGGEGDWRLEVTSELDLTVLSYVRTTDGFLASMHDVAPVAEDGSHRVVFFNPSSNTEQVSKLRLVNDGERAASVTVTGIDDNGTDSGTAELTVRAGLALTFTSAELETGSDRITGSLGDGEGRWRLRVRSNESITVMSLLETPSGLLTNMSTGTAD